MTKLRELYENWLLLKIPIKNHPNVFTVANVLYNFDEHFPMAIVTDTKEVMVNFDKYNMTTSKHRNEFTRLASLEGFKIIQSNTEEMQKYLLTKDNN